MFYVPFAAICFTSYMLFIPPSVNSMCPCHNSLYIEYVLVATYSMICPCCHLLYITFALLPSTICILFVPAVTYPILHLVLLLPTLYLMCPCCHLLYITFAIVAIYYLSYLSLLLPNLYHICSCCYLLYILCCCPLLNILASILWAWCFLC